MNWTKIAEFSQDTDIRPLHEFLTTRQIPHRISEKPKMLELWLFGDTYRQEVESFIRNPIRPNPQTNSAELNAQSMRKGDAQKSGFALWIARVPITLLIIACGLLGYLAVDFESLGVAQHMLFLPIGASISEMQPWRVLTPVFLHFGSLHILFNALWIWEFGRRIELFVGKWLYSLIFIAIAIGSNYFQFIGISSDRFGGLSGVVYGFMGYLMVWGRYHPSPLLKVPSSVFVFMLVWLALGYTGIIDFFINGSLGNAAHLGGLICGCVIAGIHVAYIKNKRVK